MQYSHILWMSREGFNMQVFKIFPKLLFYQEYLKMPTGCKVIKVLEMSRALK